MTGCSVQKSEGSNSYSFDSESLHLIDYLALSLGSDKSGSPDVTQDVRRQVSRRVETHLRVSVLVLIPYDV